MLIYWRKCLGYNQGDVAEKIGVSRVTVANWETGKSVPYGKNLLKLAKLYGVTPGDILKALGICEYGEQ